MRMNRKIRKSWFYQWNYEAPLYWFKDWLKKNYKKLYKILFRSCAILIGIWLSGAIPNVINEVYADFTSYQIMIKKQKEQIIKEAQEREAAYLLKLQREEEEKKYNEKLKREEEERQKQEVQDEIITKYGLFSWIEITWWRDIANGPNPPPMNSRAGQIKKVDGDRIYGTWGNEVLIYDKDCFHLISHKEYLDIRKNEQLKKDRAEAKKNKKFKSWGLYPGTVKSKYE